MGFSKARQSISQFLNSSIRSPIKQKHGTNKELKMKYWIDRIKVKQGSSFTFLGGRNCTHKNNTIKLRTFNGIIDELGLVEHQTSTISY